MNLSCRWNDKLAFTAEAGGHSVRMDTKPPLGDDSAMTPKQLVVAGLCGCTAMDVVAFLKKNKQPLEELSVDAKVAMTEGSYPIVFKSIHLTYRVKGALDSATLTESVRLSQDLYCGVSAMLIKAVPITYSIELNGERVDL